MFPVTYTKVTTNEQWSELRSFAASFGHTVNDATRTPIFMVRRGGKLFGYYSLQPFPVVFGCFHNDYTSPRDFAEAVSQIRATQWQLTSGNDRYPNGNCFACFDSNEKTTRALERMGFKRIGSLYESIG